VITPVDEEQHASTAVTWTRSSRSRGERPAQLARPRYTCEGLVEVAAQADDVGDPRDPERAEEASRVTSVRSTTTLGRPAANASV
jgi:hypothetical protein